MKAHIFAIHSAASRFRGVHNVVDHVQTALSELIQAKQVCVRIFQMDETNRVLIDEEILSSNDVSHGVAKLCIERKEVTTRANDQPNGEHGGNSSPAIIMAAPLIVNDFAVGVVTVVDPPNLLPQQIEILQEVSEHAAVALGNAIALDHQQLQRRKAEALLTVVRNRYSNDPLKVIWRVCIDAIAKMLHPVMCSIFLCDNVNKEVFNVGTLDGDDIAGLTLPFGKGIIGTVAQTGVTLRTHNAYEDPRFFRLVDQFTGSKTKAVCCVPVPGFNRNSGAIAVVEVINKADGTAFTWEEEEALTEVCAELSVMIRLKAMEISQLRNRVKKISKLSSSSSAETDDRELEESFLREYGAVVKQYVGDNANVSKELSFLGNGKLSSTETTGISSEEMMDLITNHNTDPFLLQDDLMIEMSLCMVRSYGLMARFGMDHQKLRTFFTRVRSKYRPSNSFHNFKHAWGVMHLSFVLLRSGVDEYLTALDIMVLLLSAICHDMDHPGNNNAFEAAIRSELSILYSDDSVLERHHLAVTNELMDDHSINLLSGLAPEQLVEFRQSVTSAILATDMVQHFKLLADIQRRISTATPYKMGELESRRALIGHVLHAADIGAQTQCHTVAMKWTERLIEEFSTQAKREIQLNIPLTPFLHGLDDELKRMQLQSGFVTGIVAPLWNALAAAFPRIELPIRQLEENGKFYMEQVERITLERAAGK